MQTITLDAIREAARRIEPYAHRTPVLRSDFFNKLLDADVRFKCENFQKVGAFKFRGACNAVFTVEDIAGLSGVVTHSSGNHGQALALAAMLRGIQATVVMPRTAPTVKRAAVTGYGATVVSCEPTEPARQAAADAVIDQTGAQFIHPFNDRHIIAGQGTAALELIEADGPFDLLVAPVGGGGLISGTALAAAALCPQTRVIGVEPNGADDACRSLHAGMIIPSVDPCTIADGLLTSLGDLTFPIIQRHVRAIVTVSDKAIIRAMRAVWERMKIVIEPSAAVPVAALMERRVDASGKRVGVILSGGNVELDRLPWVVSSH